MDSELDAINARRLAELQAQAAGKSGQGMDPQRQMQAQQAKEDQEERRQAILQQILLNDARERLSRIHLVKPDKARRVEDMIIQAAQMGRLTSQVSENQLIQMLEQLSQSSKTQKVTIQRKRYQFDDDDDDDDY